MPEITPHISLKKPLASESADISVINENMDKIDSALGDLSTVPTTAKTAAGAITELFTNVSDGKAAIAAAITDKGLPTAADDTYAEMADNIEAIPVGPDTSDATATAADILAPKTVYGAAGTKLTGTMVDRGNMSFTPGPTTQTIPAGKHGGSGQVAAVVVSADKVLVGTTIAGTTGTIPIRNGDNLATTIQPQAGVRLYFKPPVGYYDGVDGWVYYNDANFSAANILSGKNIFGLPGTLLTGGISLSAPTERLTSSETPVSLKKATVNYTGRVRISFAVMSDSSNWPKNAQIYKNGTAAGTRRGAGATWVTVVEDFNCNAGDVFELMCWGQFSIIRISDFTILSFEVPPYNGIVNVD